MKTKCFLMFVLISCLFLAGCSQKLPEGMNESDLEKAALRVLTLVQEKDYDTIVAESAPLFQDAVTGPELRDAVEEQIEKLGAFDKVSKSSYSGASGKNASEKYGIAVLSAQYENGSAVYTFSFDMDYRLVGFYVK